jgi:predicted RNase H-like nuclease (RuvC/YqgF family)
MAEQSATAELERLRELVASLRREVAEQRKEIAALREERAALLAADRPMPWLDMETRR